MIKAGLTVWQALGMTFLVFAGSAQLAALPLMLANAPVMVIFATAMMVNLRFVIFGAAIGPHFSHLPWYRRLWYGYFNGDIAVGLFPLRFPPETLYRPAGKVGFYMGIEVIEKRITRDEMYCCDEAFFTGTAAEITPIRELDNRQIGAGHRGPITEKLQTLFFEVVAGRAPQYQHWLTLV